MKILVVSDSHGNRKALMRAVSATGPDMVLHLGDIASDCGIIRENMPELPVRAVRGNCDGFANEAAEDEFTAGGRRIFMAHGDRYGVKTGLNSFITSAMYRNADIALFGHTHRNFSMEYEGMLILNPGSVGTEQKTYAVLEIRDGAVKYDICDLML